MPTLEDINPISVYHTGWDQFQLKIDAVDHYTYPATDRWAYVFNNDDNNKIKARTKIGTIPYVGLSSFTVNDGSMGNLDITSAGNAFPTVCFDPNGGEVYIGWYTTYDPGITAPTPNNPLYQYSSGSQRYIGVLLTPSYGTLLSTTMYWGISVNNSTNYIGQGIGLGTGSNDGYPKICFSKNNDGDQMFSVFAEHQSVDMMNVYSGAIIPNYFEAASGLYWTTYGPVYQMNYAGWGGTPPGYLSPTGVTPAGTPGTESFYMSHKMNNWWTSASVYGTLFKQTQPVTTWAIAPNPFTNSLHISSSNNSEMQVDVTDMLGRTVGNYSGSNTAINNQLDRLAGTLYSGTYVLHASSVDGTQQTFKVTKL